MYSEITVRGARLHNLRNVTVTIPKYRLVVMTGVSGSGKSTLAFDILLKEGQRQYMESLGLIPFGLARPPVEAITGLSPTISIDSRAANRSPRSTVGTYTDVYTYLRVLYARLGRRPCPRCGSSVPPSGLEPIGDDLDDAAPSALDTVPCPSCGAPLSELGMAGFSFNKPEGACPTCTGLGVLQRPDIGQLVDDAKSIVGGAVIGWNAVLIDYHAKVLKAAAAHFGFDLDISRPVSEFTSAQRDLLLYGVESPAFRRHFPGIEPPATVRGGRFEGIATSLLRRYADHIGQHAADSDYQDRLDEVVISEVCPDCGGTRLRPESRAVTVSGLDIVSAARLPLTGLSAWLDSLPADLAPEELRISGPVLDELRLRVGRLVEVGAGYLFLDRASPSLSAGESQRLRLATLLGSGLTGVLYVLDEPTIGLHQRDTARLIGVLRRLRDLDNTVLVVEHDLETIAAADHIVDLGPGAGRNGGQVVAAGTPAEVAANPDSVTGAYLAGRASIAVPPRRSPTGGPFLLIRGARQHNLRDINVRVPLGVLVAVTGVSGSGKTTLVFDILDRVLRQRLYRSREVPGDHDAIDGLEQVGQVITIDQAHLARLPRSNVATYSEVFAPIRAAFAATPDARRLALSSRHFSFNVPGGRCERCEGTGLTAVKMHFLPEVEVRCPACRGRRFTGKTLAVRYQGHDISQVLGLTVDEALDVFAGLPAAATRLRALSGVGLGYLQLGQSAATLSGGEAQRVKLAKELGRRGGGRTLYLMDEPTTGLHPADTARLLGVLQRLVDAGSTVVLVEHNLELIKAADWVIDLGPEGGAAGGQVVAEGTPEQVAEVEASWTGKALRRLLFGLNADRANFTPQPGWVYVATDLPGVYACYTGTN